MSQMIRRGKSAKKLATVLCILSSGMVAAGDNVPEPLLTSTPFRINPETMLETSFALSSSASSGDLVTLFREQPPKLRQVSDQDFGWRELKAPIQATVDENRETDASRADDQTNRFVKLQRNSPASRGGKFGTTRSAALPQRRRPQRAEIQTNPLLVGAPPTLRQFSIHERPLIEPVHSPEPVADGRQFAREQPLSDRQVNDLDQADLDQAFDRLSVDSVDQGSGHKTAQDDGLGMLAIDQIGKHLSKSADGSTNFDPPVKRFSTDPVLPLSQDHGSAPTLSEQLIAAGEQTFALQDMPLLPPPDESSMPHSVSRNSIVGALDAFGPEGLVQQTHRPGSVEADSNQAVLLNQALGNRSGMVAMNLDELIAANSNPPKSSSGVTREQQSKGTKRPSIAQRLTGWSRKTLRGDKPTRPKSEPTQSTGDQTHRKQSVGIMTEWFNRTR